MHIIKKLFSAHPTQEEFILLALLFALATGINMLTVLPGDLMVMALFFVLLKMGILKAERLAIICPFLLVHISFFFIPPAVKVVEQTAALEGVAGKLICILVISNILVMGVTGCVVQAVIKKGAKHA